MRSARNAKIMMVSGICLMALAGIIFLLVVLPAMHAGSTPSMAQPPPPGPEDEMGPPAPEGEMGPGGPGMGPGMEPGMGGPGMMGPGGGQAQAAPAEPAGETGPPIEPNRANPFGRPGMAAGEEAFEDIDIQRIGPNWSSVPVTQRMGFVAPEVPDREAAPPPPEPFKLDKHLRVTSIMWTKEGQAMAVYEYGTGPEAESGVIRPGGRLTLDDQNLLIVQVRQDHIIVRNRDTGDEKRIYLTEKAPEPEEPE